MAVSYYGGNVRMVHKIITNMAKIYMKKFPGRDSSAPNHRFHELINKCFRTPYICYLDRKLIQI